MTHYIKTIDLMQLAKEKIQYPRIHLHNGFVLQRAGARAKFPGSINITDGKAFGRNVWYGNISTHGYLKMPTHMQDHSELLQTELDLFQLDPAKYASAYGKATANCMFCHKELTAQQSIAVGYGPTCAVNYGLPWGELDAETAKKMSSLDLDLDKLDNELAKEVELVGHPDQLPPTIDTACNETQTASITATLLAIEKLNDVAIMMLSEANQTQLAELVKANPNDEYNLLLTFLWEHTQQ